MGGVGTTFVASDPEALAVALVADPGLPCEIAEELAETLAEQLARSSDGRCTWTVRASCERLPADENGEIRLAELVRAHGGRDGIDYVVCLTDQPRMTGGRSIVADANTVAGVALASLPALGVLWLHARSRRAVSHLVSELANERLGLWPDGEAPPWGRLRRTVPTDEDDVDLRFLARGAWGRLRLLAGMVRANRPWRLVPHLTGAFAAALATGAYVLITPSVWQLADALGPIRLSGAAVLAIATMVVWLIVDHHLWERRGVKGGRRLARLYNATTVVTVAVGVLCLYGGLLLLGAVADRVLLDGGVLHHQLRHPITWRDHATVVWMASSMGTVAGALGTGFQDEEAVRQAAYGFRQRERRRKQEEEAALEAAG